eukprot:1978616-Prymnesium_polylepis.1
MQLRGASRYRVEGRRWHAMKLETAETERARPLTVSQHRYATAMGPWVHAHRRTCAAPHAVEPRPPPRLTRPCWPCRPCRPWPFWRARAG